MPLSVLSLDTALGQNERHNIPKISGYQNAYFILYTMGVSNIDRDLPVDRQYVHIFSF